MKTPNATEMVVKLAREAEQRRLLEIANGCKDLEELKARLKAMIGDN